MAQYAPYRKRDFNRSTGYSYNNSGNYQFQKPQRELKAHSGAVYGTYKRDKQGLLGGTEDVPYVRGWNYTKRDGTVSFFCSPYKNTHEYTTKSGKIFHTWICKITDRFGKSSVVPCSFEPATKRVFLNGANFMLHPNARRSQTNGKGYAGKIK
jgi:hypothetical protein